MLEIPKKEALTQEIPNPLQFLPQRKKEQGRIHGNTVAGGWAGAEMRKPLGIQKCDGRMDGRTNGPTYRPTRQGVESRVRD